MTQSKTNEMDILLIAQSSYRAALLQERMRQVGLCCTIRRVGPGKKAIAYLTGRTPYRNASQPDLVLIDMVNKCPVTLNTIENVAFGDNRSSAPVVLMVNRRNELLLENNEFGTDDATIFSSHTLNNFLGKLVGKRQPGFMRALRTLYQYGPIMTRLPQSLQHDREQSTAVSA